jgi:hypothetical protein
VQIKLNVQPLSIDDDFDITPVQEGSSLVKLVRAVASAMENHPELKSVQSLVDPKYRNELVFPGDDAVIEVDVLLCGRHEDIPMIIDSSMQAPLGVFATSSGSFDRTRWAADRFRVVMACDEEYLRGFVLSQRDMESNPGSDLHDIEYLSAYLTTLTHEIAHAVEFIAHGGGLTPEEVDNAFDEELFDWPIKHVCNGQGIRQDMSTHLSDEEADEIMEDRVEAQGAKWLEWALTKVPKSMVSDCLKACAPIHKRHAHEVSYPGY